MLATLSLRAVVLADLLSFLLAAALLLGVRRDTAPVRKAGGRLPAALREGLQVVRGSGPLRLLVGLAGLAAVGEGIFGTLLAPFVTEVMRGDARTYGLIVGVQAVGGLLGGALAAHWAARLNPVALLVGGGVGLGLGDLAFFALPLVSGAHWPPLLVMALVGVPAAASGAGWTTLVQRLSPDTAQGRVFGLAGHLMAVGCCWARAWPAWRADRRRFCSPYVCTARCNCWWGSGPCG